VALSAAALPAALAEAASAAVPAALLDSTIRAAVLLPAAKAVAAGAVTLPVAALAEGVLRTMFVTQLKVAATGAKLLNDLIIKIWIRQSHERLITPSLRPRSPSEPYWPGVSSTPGRVNEILDRTVPSPILPFQAPAGSR